MSVKLCIVALLSVATFSVSAVARESIVVVGSSTVYPFTSYVAKDFHVKTNHTMPEVKSTGTGGGMKLFCAGAGLDTPDMTDASRPMKLSEYETCVKNGVTDITGMKVGFDGIAFAQSKSNGAITLTRDQIFLALAKEVPSLDGKSLIKNPYKTWNEIDSKLPNRQITVYGPPTTSGTRDSFEEMVMEHSSKHFEAYGVEKGKYKEIREDDVYVPAAENDELVVRALTRDLDAFGIFGYSYLEENGKKINGALIDGIEPNFETISSGKYPIARSLYVYIKNSHRIFVGGMDAFLKYYMSEKMVGINGTLRKIGLVPMSDKEYKEVRKVVLAKTKLTEAMVKKNTILP